MTDFENWRNIPCILEVDLEYPKNLHDLHNDYPLAPERLLINKVEKLVPNLRNKTKICCSSPKPKTLRRIGIGYQKDSQRNKFEEKPFMKKYIDLNTKLKANAKNDFENNFFKVMNNSVFGKTMENIRKRVR